MTNPTGLIDEESRAPINVSAEQMIVIIDAAVNSKERAVRFSVDGKIPLILKIEAMRLGDHS